MEQGARRRCSLRLGTAGTKEVTAFWVMRGPKSYDDCGVSTDRRLGSPVHHFGVIEVSVVGVTCWQG